MGDERNDKDTEEREARSLSARLEGLVPDAMKRALYTGLGAMFLTEEGLRRQITEMKLPKEMASYIVSQSSRTKEELFEAIAREIAKVFQGVEPEQLLRQVLTGTKVNLNVEVGFEPAEPGEETPRAKVKFRTKPSKDNA